MAILSNFNPPKWADPLPPASPEHCDALGKMGEPGLPLSVLPTAVRRKLEAGESVPVSEIVQMLR